MEKDTPQMGGTGNALRLFFISFYSKERRRGRRRLTSVWYDEAGHTLRDSSIDDCIILSKLDLDDGLEP